MPSTALATETAHAARHPLPADGLVAADTVPAAGEEDPAAGSLPPDGPTATIHAPPPDDPPFRALMDRNFLSYASYVIRDRAIPALEDGLKPVQRRIMHSLHKNDDGKFIKVANIVGYTMQFHPHGDVSIADALVVLQQKTLPHRRAGELRQHLHRRPGGGPRATSSAA